MDREVAMAVPLPGGLAARAVFRDDPARWLPDARPQGARRWLVTLSAVGIERPVLCTVSSPLRTRSGVVRSISWEPVTTESDIVRGDRWLPGFDGHLRLVGVPDSPSLVLTGHVELPLGIIGRAADGLGLGVVADRSLDDLLRRIAAVISDEALATRAGSRSG